MARASGWIASIVSVLAVLCMIQPAAAQTASLWTSGVGGSVTANGLTFTVTSCSLAIGGVNKSSCSLINAEIVVSGTTSAPILTIQGAGGAALFTSTSSVGGTPESAGLNDLNVTISVSAGSRHLINSIGASVTGSVKKTSQGCTYSSSTKSACAAYLQKILLASDNITGATGSHNISNLNLGALSSSGYAGTVNGYACNPQTAACTFGGGHTVSVNTNIQLNGTSTSGYVLTLSNVAQTFGVVPEPLSLGVLSVGLAGLLYVRRRRRIG